jgi:hypothetical protein
VTVVLLPNVEALIGDALREHPDITALGARVAGQTPSTITLPWIRITQLDMPDVGHNLEHLIAPMLQVECYAGKAATDAHAGQMEAWRLKATTRAILKALQATETDGVYVSKVVLLGDARLPDTTMEPARERYILTVEVTAHAISA